MNPEMDRVEFRADLDKRIGTYFVIADDEGVYERKVWRDADRPQRYVLEVQRASDDPTERYVQVEDLDAACRDSQSPLRFLTYEAVSQGHAAHLALRAYAERQAFEELADVFYADELAFTGAGFTNSPN